MTDKIEFTDEEWRARLTPEQYSVLRQGGTERAFAGAYDANKAAGVYLCAGCGTPLFASDTKYNSGSGWPSYTAPVAGKARLPVGGVRPVIAARVVVAPCPMSR